jgi:hypothetical protein
MSARALVLRLSVTSCIALSLFAQESASALGASAPVVESESVESVGYTVATLQARVDQGEEAASYYFEYGLDESYGMNQPASTTAIGSAPNKTEVSQELAGLTAGLTYHYRVVVTNASGTTAGPDHVFATFSNLQGGNKDECPNAALRAAGLSSGLPDCRAYEMVSPVSKNGGDVIGQNDTNTVSVSGDQVLYASHVAFGNTSGSGGDGINQYVAMRGKDSWTTYPITSTPAVSAAQVFFGGTFNELFSSELDRSVEDGYALPGSEGGVPEGINLYVEDTKSKRLETVTNPEGGATVVNPFAAASALRGGSADLGVVAFQSNANFLPQVSGSNQKLFAMEHGVLRLVGILPDGSIPPGGSESPLSSRREALSYNDAVSADGSRILFVAPVDGSTAPQLYMRENNERTSWVSQSESSTPNPEPQNVKFLRATRSGEVLFSSTSQLVDADPGGSAYGLYLYVPSAQPAADSNLTFIARVASQPVVVGMSEHADRVYFVAGSTLYLWNAGITQAIAEPVELREGEYEGGQFSVSADGERLALLNPHALTSSETGGLTEMYLYDAPSKKLICVSCPPNGARARTGVDAIPFATSYGIELGIPFLHHFLSSTGRYAFFSTGDSLLPQDTNDLADAYEYDAETGVIALISSGSSNDGAWFIDASPSGKDVFFVTRQAYSRSDVDTLVDLYDARVDGGLPEALPPAVPCAGDACQGVPSAVPLFNSASGFNGLGNAKTRSVSMHRKAKPAHKAKKKSHKKRGKKRTKSHVRFHNRTGR